jgi:hypothetical protein
MQQVNLQLELRGVNSCSGAMETEGESTSVDILATQDGKAIA